MQLGIFSWYGYEATLSQRLHHLRQAGFTSTMLWWGESALPDPQIDADFFKKAVDLGVTIENIHVPFQDADRLWAVERDVHSAYMSQYLQHIDFAAKHKLLLIVMHASKGYQVQKQNRYGIDAMRRLTEYAHSAGVSIAVENTRRVQLVEALLDAIDNRNLGLCYDTSHGRLYERGHFYLLKKFPHRLKCLHISDNDGQEDRHWNIKEGVIDWDSFVQHLPRGSELQALSLEVYPKNDGQSEQDFLQEAYSRVNALRKLIEKRTS